MNNLDALDLSSSILSINTDISEQAKIFLLQNNILNKKENTAGDYQYSCEFNKIARVNQETNKQEDHLIFNFAINKQKNQHEFEISIPIADATKLLKSNDTLFLYTLLCYQYNNGIPMIESNVLKDLVKKNIINKKDYENIVLNGPSKYLTNVYKEVSLASQYHPKTLTEDAILDQNLTKEEVLAPKIAAYKDITTIKVSSIYDDSLKQIPVLLKPDILIDKKEFELKTESTNKQISKPIFSFAELNKQEKNHTSEARLDVNARRSSRSL